MNYTGKARAFYDKLHTLRVYNYNTLYRAEDGTVYYINKRGYMHIFTARKSHFDGRELYLIIDRLLTESGTLKESNARYYDRQQAMELVQEMQTAADENTKAARLDMINLGYIEAVEGPQTTQTAAGDETPTAANTAQQEGSQEPTEGQTALYKYGMRLRGYSIGAQPAGVVLREDDPTGAYYDIISYNVPLSQEDIKHYSLTPLEDPTTEETTTAGQTTTAAETAPQEATSDAGPAADNNGTTAAETATEGPETSTPAQDTTGSDTRPPRATEEATTGHAANNTSTPATAAGDHTRPGPAAGAITGTAAGRIAARMKNASKAGHACEIAPGRTERAQAVPTTTPPHKRPPRGKTRAGPARPAAKEGRKKLDFGIYEKISQKYQVQKSSTLFNHRFFKFLIRN